MTIAQNNSEQKRVLVAMSGGVDSSVAAALLKEQGYFVIGATMQLWDYRKNEMAKNKEGHACDPTARFDTCCSLEDVSDARRVADTLDIPFYVFDYQDDFERDVVDYFTSEYLAGRTPNPCVACNTFLKFDHLLERAGRLGCDFVATGHYAQIAQHEKTGLYSLSKGLDSQKDQSYFLYSFSQQRLSKVLFPVGHMDKSQVRSIAEKYHLINAKKKESMEICFVPNNDYAAFIESRVGKHTLTAGSLVHEKGTVLGQHEGIHHFTVGQRKGLKISWPEPLYVTRIDSHSHTVYVGEECYLFKKSFTLKDMHFINPAEAAEAWGKEFQIKIRYRGAMCAGVLWPPGYGGVWQRSQPIIELSTPQRSVTPGQIAVLYRDDQVVGGGVIDQALDRDAH